MTQFQKGTFDSYRATVSIHLGTRADYIPEGDVVQFDGYTLKLSDGEELQVATVKGAVTKGWLVPVSDQTSTYKPVSSGIEVHSAQQAGNDRTGKMSIGTAVDDMQEVGTIAAAAEARKRAGNWVAERRGMSKMSQDILAELAEATGSPPVTSSTQPSPKAAPVHEQVKAEPRRPKFPVEEREEEPVRLATLKKPQNTGAIPVTDPQVRQFAGASEPSSPITSGKGSSKVVLGDDQEAETVFKLGSAKFGKVDISEGNGGGREVRSVRPKMEKSAARKKSEAQQLAALRADGTLKSSQLDMQSIEDVLDAAAEDEEGDGIATGDVERAIEGDELESLLPDAVSSGTPEPGEAGEGDDPHLTQEEKFQARNSGTRDPKVEAIRAFVPDFEWDLTRHWRERVKDAVDNYADDEVWMKAILAVESDSVKTHIEKRLNS